jgi:phospholipid/cholesterol/gamma-HCH transport system permease protein
VAQELTKQGAGELVGALVSIAILRELAPIMTGFAVIAMVGSAYSAELATMQIQKQIDALKVLHVNPIRYLVLPRVLAATCMLPLMTILTAMAGIVGGMVISYFIGGLNYNNYLESVWRQVETKDVLGAMLKAGVFGALIAMLSTTIGLRTKGGAKEVGTATTRAVVWSFVAMALADYVLSFLLFKGD